VKRERTKTALPLVLRGTRAASENGFVGKDVHGGEDPLPPVVESVLDGQLSRDSRFTRVSGETTDDR